MTETAGEAAMEDQGRRRAPAPLIFAQQGQEIRRSDEVRTGRERVDMISMEAARRRIAGNGRPGTAAARRTAVIAVLAFATFGASPAAAQTSDLVNRATLRVCADPADMPLSNEKGEGYENKIAELLAKDLGIPLVYTWFPQATGFYRMTLGIKRCDVVLGVAQGADPYLNTNAYVRSTSLLIVKKGGPLDGVDQLSDERLKDKRIGVISGTPAASYLSRFGLMGKAKPYSLTIDRRYFSPAEDMIKDVQSGEIDAGVLWGPIGGYFADKAGGLSMTSLVKESGNPPMTYRLTFGVRPGEDNWKHRLNEFISKNQAEINKILASYHVPLVDEQDKPIVVTQ
jgi:quinoprotein dehydrogenase-associated probable ABC transporter substrate-binding protein